MRKLLYLLVICSVLMGCSSSGEKSDVSMDSFVKAFESEGVKANTEEKPMFSLIGAKDGIMFYNDDQPVKIYEFEDEKAISEAEKTLPAMKDWDKNGLFVLETSHDKSKEIFKSVK